MKKLICIAALALLGACHSDGDGGGGHATPPDSNPPASTLDAFFTAVQGFIGMAPEDTEPAAIDGVAVTSPEDKEPDKVD